MLLIQTFEKRVRDYLKQGRSKKVFYNVLNSFLVKIVSTVVTLSLIPLSLNYTDAKTYGVWLTLSSVITWVQFFDLGLSNGLANRLAVAFTNDDNKLAKQYISVTYSFLIVIAAVLSTVFLFVSPYINWNKIFNTTIDRRTLLFSVNFSFISLCITFLLRPVNDLLRSKQKHFLIGIIQVVSNTLALVCLLLFARYFNSDLSILAIILGGAYPLTLIVSSIILYRKKYPDLKPTINLKRFERLREIFGISLKFFLINASGIAILASNNLLISYFINPESVTYYNIAYRLFSIVMIFQAMIVTPLWPAFTEAFTIKDYKWIRTTIRGLNKLNIALAVMILLVFVLSKYIYAFWIGPNMNIPFEVNFLLTIYVIIALYKESYVSTINGSGKLNLQTIFAVVSIILQVPLAYLLLKVFNLGMWGILSLNIFWVTVGFILWKTQFNIITRDISTRKIWQ